MNSGCDSGCQVLLVGAGRELLDAVRLRVGSSVASVPDSNSAENFLRTNPCQVLVVCGQRIAAQLAQKLNGTTPPQVLLVGGSVQFPNSNVAVIEKTKPSGEQVARSVTKLLQQVREEVGAAHSQPPAKTIPAGSPTNVPFSTTTPNPVSPTNQSTPPPISAASSPASIESGRETTNITKAILKIFDLLSNASADQFISTKEILDSLNWDRSAGNTTSISIAIRRLRESGLQIHSEKDKGYRLTAEIPTGFLVESVLRERRPPPKPARPRVPKPETHSPETPTGHLEFVLNGTEVLLGRGEIKIRLNSTEVALLSAFTKPSSNAIQQKDKTIILESILQRTLVSCAEYIEQGIDHATFRRILTTLNEKLRKTFGFPPSFQLISSMTVAAKPIKNQLRRTNPHGSIGYYLTLPIRPPATQSESATADPDQLYSFTDRDTLATALDHLQANSFLLTLSYSLSQVFSCHSGLLQFRFFREGERWCFSLVRANGRPYHEFSEAEKDGVVRVLATAAKLLPGLEIQFSPPEKLAAAGEDSAAATGADTNNPPAKDGAADSLTDGEAAATGAETPRAKTYSLDRAGIQAAAAAVYDPVEKRILDEFLTAVSGTLSESCTFRFEKHGTVCKVIFTAGPAGYEDILQTRDGFRNAGQGASRGTGRSIRAFPESGLKK